MYTEHANRKCGELSRPAPTLSPAEAGVISHITGAPGSLGPKSPGPNPLTKVPAGLASDATGMPPMPEAGAREQCVSSSGANVGSDATFYVLQM